jgi:hypothetical protein
MAEPRVCAVAGCDKPRKNGSYCWGHYERNRKYGDPLAGGTQRGTLLKYVFEVAIPYCGDDCLIWPFASKTVKGYATVNWNGKTKEVHRLVCEIVNGPSPGKIFQASHECGKGHLGCINPRHLFWKTRKENDRDKLRHGTRFFGEAIAGSKLNEQQVREIRSLRDKLMGFEVAKIYGVSPTTVHEIQVRKTWKWVE